MNRPQARDGLPQPQRLRAMLVVLTGLSMSVLDGAIANIALLVDDGLMCEQVSGVCGTPLASK
jgi:hypothetical protein